MKEVSEHLAAVLDLVGPLPPLDVVLHDASGCVLAEDVAAPADLPARDLAALDGYAVRSHDVEGAGPDREVTLRVLDDLRAGSVSAGALVPMTGVRIASGAPMPREADAVVALTDTDRGDASVRVFAAVRPGANVRRQGEDLRSGEIALAAGVRIGSRHIALLGALGRQRVGVHPRPRVVIISVGDELVEPGRLAGEGQVFDANGHALATGVQDAGGSTFRVAAVPDERAELREVLEDQLVRADLILTTGGLSFGANDTVKEVLSPLGTVRFDNVGITPGRQYGVGTVGEGTPILCLPGDPVAAQIGFEVFVRPALLAMAGKRELYRPTVRARVTTGWQSPWDRREFVPATIVGSPADGYRATPAAAPTSPALSALARGNALVVVPQDMQNVAAGTELNCLLLDS
ncbi:gephyrin-like molybdotransferase Glp [Pseudactinotalea sp. HY158]|uniref:molybdopterin molybdotransferase MoeA n=1 Tax=unclassified Pseudactinotalea TaxID=2649176 RepID=UPI00129CE5A5|nr:gephyrin-like molybdotransferase Glp [Pseudactinotalea sp. HY158]MPV48603.1 molybdopterin molybdenumtransferase MoeA [Pseudactinotalea sp. HY160]QGH68578.1 molybdopterin molybdenumtransferase MoeA [Pseudactinotalea sp. HY158]